MEINEETLFKVLQKLKKSELLAYLQFSFQEMGDKQKRNVFQDLYKERIINKTNPKELYSKISIFYKKSVRGEYFAPFNWNSKNYSHIPKETDKWFSEIGFFLDETSRLVKKKEYRIANDCFGKLFDLIEKMESGEEIVFAHEYGTWMLTNALDYEEAYNTLLLKK